MENIIKQIAGKVFKDGPYEYRIYMKSADLGTVITSISIFIENTPDQVGVDLIMYALAHLIDVGGEELKTSESEFMINKIIMEEYESLGEMISAMGLSSEFGVQSFEDLNKRVLNNKDKKVDLAEINRKIKTRSAKLQKALEYAVRLFEKEYNLQASVSHPVSGRPKRTSGNTIFPGLDTSITIWTPENDYAVKNDLRDKMKSIIDDVTPIEITQNDNIKIDVVHKA